MTTARSDSKTFRFWGHLPPTPGARQFAAVAPSGDSEEAVIRLYDPIDSWGGDWGVSAKEFVEALDGVGAQTNLRLHVNSPGGEVFEGIAILNALRNHQGRVTVVVDGLAASAASFIAMAADEIVMGRNAEMMIHDAWGFAIGNAADMHDMADRLDHLSNNVASVYAGRAGGSVDDWRAHMLAETWYSADEAVAAGLADRVQDDTVNATNRFDLSVFKHEGRAQAPAPLPVAAATPPTDADRNPGAESESADEAAASAADAADAAAKSAEEQALARLVVMADELSFA